MKPNYKNFDPAAPKDALHRELMVKVTPDPTNPDIIDMRASDQTLDRYGEVVLAAGWQLDYYRKNPVIQNAHQYGDIIHTIGKALITEVKGNELVQRWEFASTVNPLAKIAAGLYRGGFLNASSVGFIPIDYTNGKAGEPARTYTKCELLEVSAVGIPANPNALKLGFDQGAVDKGDLRELHQILKNYFKSSPSPGEALPVIVDVKSSTVWRCPHCLDQILEKSLLLQGKDWIHRPCGEKIILPDHAKTWTEKNFCSDKAGSPSDAGAPGSGTDGAQLVQLARAVADLVKR